MDAASPIARSTAGQNNDSSGTFTLINAMKSIFTLAGFPSVGLWRKRDSVDRRYRPSYRRLAYGDGHQ